MKFTVNTKDFSRALGAFKGIVAKKADPWFRTHVLLRASSQGLILRGTDLETRLEIRCDAEAEQADEIGLHYATMAERVGSLDSADCRLEAERTGWVILRGGTASFKIPYMDPQDYPAMGQAPSDAVAVPSAILLDLLDAVSYAASAEAARRGLCGVHLSETPKEITMAATDGYRLARASHQRGPADPLLGLPEITIPRGALGPIGRALQCETVQVAVHEGKFWCIGQDASVSAALIQERFPDIGRIIPKQDRCEHRIPIATASLAAACRRVSDAGDNSTITMSVRDGRIWVRSIGISGETAEDWVETPYGGAVAEVGLNGKYLAEALGHLPEDAVLGLSGAMAPILVAAEGREAVLMPVRL